MASTNNNECVVCYKAEIALSLACTHTICRECLALWSVSCDDRDLDITCPCCRHFIGQRPSSTMEDLEEDMLWVEEMERSMIEHLILIQSKVEIMALKHKGVIDKIKGGQVQRAGGTLNQMKQLANEVASSVTMLMFAASNVSVAAHDLIHSTEAVTRSWTEVLGSQQGEEEVGDDLSSTAQEGEVEDVMSFTEEYVEEEDIFSFSEDFVQEAPRMYVGMSLDLFQPHQIIHRNNFEDYEEMTNLGFTGGTATIVDENTQALYGVAFNQNHIITDSYRLPPDDGSDSTANV